MCLKNIDEVQRPSHLAKKTMMIVSQWNIRFYDGYSAHRTKDQSRIFCREDHLLVDLNISSARKEIQIAKK
jgi:hypothetical protein